MFVFIVVEGGLRLKGFVRLACFLVLVYNAVDALFAQIFVVVYVHGIELSIPHKKHPDA